MATKVGATFTIGYGLKVPEDADKVGACQEQRRQIIHATNFIIDSDKKVTQACYSIGPIGRIVAEDALRSRGEEEKSAERLVACTHDLTDNAQGVFAILAANISVRHHADSRGIHGAR